MAGVAFTALGRVAVRVDGVERAVPGRRERAVLGVLLAARGQVVSVDRLVDEVWGSSPPETARGSLQVAVSRLRSLIEPGRARGAEPDVLVSVGAGYAVRVVAETVDTERFAALVPRAQERLAAGDPGAALEAADEAGALWTGPAYLDVPGDLAAAEAARLDELRLCLVELRAEALLGLGREALVPGELTAFVDEHPYRERGWQLLALAFYRAGRQADALAALRRARKVFLDELGVDPSPALEQLESQVLRHDPALLAPPPTTAPVAAVAAVAAPVPARVGDGIVGRAEVLGTLHAHVTALAQGSGGTLVVSGEAGIGKTRLAGATADLAEQQGLHVVWGRCHEADVSPAYWPWVPVVRELAGAHPPPEVAALLSHDPVAGGMDAQSAALRTYDAVARLVSSAAAECPVLVVLEDLHWADTASLQLLAFAAEAWVGRPVLVLVTVRMPEAAPEGLAACLAALARQSATRIHLPGLGTDAVGALVRAQSGSPENEDRDEDRDLAEVVAARTDGNPFFVIELVRLLESEDRLDIEGARDIAVPHGVQDVLRLRLARLGDDVRSLLSVAAVGGREIRHDLLAEVAGLPFDAVLDLLDEALAASVIEESPDGGLPRFTHALVRETLAGSLSRTRSSRLHAAYGQALEARLTHDPDLVAEVAHHLALGAVLQPDLAVGAVRHSVAAARLAEGRGALDRARVHWEQARAADVLARVPDPRRRFEVLVGLGRARYRLGDVAGSRAALDTAVRLAQELGDVERVAEAATSFRAGVWHWREFGTTDPEMTALLRDCLAQLPEGALQARVLASLSMELMYAWQSEEAEALGQRAVDVARRVGDDALFADVLSLHELMIFGRPGAVDARLRLAEEALARPLTQEQELYAHFGAANAHLQAGDTARAEEQMQHARTLARRLRHTGADVPMAWWTFHRAVDAESPEAPALLQRALDMHSRSSVVALADMGIVGRTRLAGEAAALSDAEVEHARQHPNPAFRAWVGQVLAESGQAARGVEVLGEPVPDGAWTYASMYGDCMRVQVFAAGGRLDALPAALARIEPWQDEFATFGSTDCAGSVAFFVGLAREAMGDLDVARDAYRRAAEANRRAGVVAWQRRAERRLAALPG